MLPKLIFPGSSSSLPADVPQVPFYDLVLDLEGERVQGLRDEDGVPGTGAGGVRKAWPEPEKEEEGISS